MAVARLLKAWSQAKSDIFRTLRDIELKPIHKSQKSDFAADRNAKFIREYLSILALITDYL